MQYETDRKLTEIRDFPSLVQYLRDDLDWPLDVEEIEDLTFEYEPEDLGLAPEHAVKVKEIKQLRPVVDRQPWGIFWVEFENRALPVTVMRQILRALVFKKRASTRAADRKAWHLRDLMFMSSLGEKGKRRINFSYFREVEEGEPTLQTFFWDEQETQFYWLDRNHLERLRWPASTSDIDTWRRQWASAFTAGYREPIRTAKDLSERLAALAARTRGFVQDALRYERSDGPLHLLFESFQKVLLHDLDEAGFADMVAQTIAYGLFSARCTGQEVLGLAHLEAMVPNTNRFLKGLLADLARISGHKKGQINFDDLGLSEMVALLRDKNIEAVLEDFGRQAGGGKEDPVIHFYETFLGVYDRQQKVQRGVFYTPKPVVSFIVRSVHEILQKEFGLPDGLADTTTWREMADRNPGLEIPAGVKADGPFVQILDPATGTGTFLEEVIDVVHKTMTAKWHKQGKSAAQQHEAWNDYVPKHLLPRLRGFELMMAPYAVAHMKLGLKLRQTEYDFKSNERLRIYLTNSLEPPESGPRKLAFLPDFLSHESMQADEVKRNKPITVIIGNPPYSYMTANLTPEAARFVERFRFVDGIRIKEKSALSLERSLQDDFVKFIGLALDFSRRASGQCVLGFITNNSYLDSPLFRGLRSELLSSFPVLRLVNLFGDSIKDHEENVFEIQQGVAILMASTPLSLPAETIVYEIHGSRDDKYRSLLANTQGTLAGGQTIAPVPPQRYFVPGASREEYACFTSIETIFPVTSTCIKTLKDDLATGFTRAEILEKIRWFRNPLTSRKDIEERFGLCDVVQWKLQPAREALLGLELDRYLLRYQARPFDYRWMFYHPAIIGSPRRRVMQHLINSKSNLALIANRKIRTTRCNHFWVTRAVCVSEVISSADNSNIFPLYLTEDDTGTGEMASLPLAAAARVRPNLNQDLVSSLGHALKVRVLAFGAGDLRETVGPEDIFHAVYAMCYSTNYRKEYESVLKLEFPRVPLVIDKRLFGYLAQHGAELVALHLMESPELNKHLTRFVGGRNPKAEKVSWSRDTVWIDKLQTTGFVGVPKAVWHFYIGGYQVCEKWLKDRKGRTLSTDDIEHYHRIVVALSETIRLMGEIDEAITEHGGWPLVGSTRA